VDQEELIATLRQHLPLVRQVDLVMKEALKRRIGKRILKEAVQV